MPKSLKHSRAPADVPQGERVPSLHRTSCCEFTRRGRLPEHLPPLNHATRECGERRRHGLEQPSDTWLGPAVCKRSYSANAEDSNSSLYSLTYSSATTPGAWYLRAHCRALAPISRANDSFVKHS